MNPEVALPEETVELCDLAIEVYAGVLQRQEAAVKVTRDEFYRAEHAAVIASNALASIRNKGWHRILKEECAEKGVELNSHTPKQKRRMRRTAYAAVGSSRLFDPTPDNAIRTLLDLTLE